ncbi:phosphatidate cytidylyltransferase [Coccomyxa subellipsoidea C-169]|uniref:Phosphatidate cytidylyltransferase n=1 Tax=Coccomyxa subellipsoidea (strain C-169) TaxID=574566 RepID=I0YZC0_COCSC|nr:phosphatidate cytidylyltransferase [Coccomyxa subellipsoidea C-169]EIE23739.1 phosphatidate cytidylyltransferase [Coccomyxa subellipsoidea C-169]|eukprot:XP_005648283.1 phosphatidate cytidylyltransferase [Coccomyxa subellipsoidea C-169]
MDGALRYRGERAATPPAPSSEDGYDTSTAQESSKGDASSKMLRYSKKKYQSLKVRAVSTVIIIASFCVIIYLGHVPLMLMILAIQGAMVRELFKLAEKSQREQTKPAGHGRLQQWYFFMVAAFWMYFRFIRNQLVVEITSNAQLARLFGWALKKHTILTFALYTAGFVSFVLKLEKGCYLYQFGNYAWTHLILLFVFIPSSFFVSNIFDGIIWFLLPCSLVIANDIFAYLSGFFFGRTPLIKLSPKKTWEGFFGGLVLTVISSWFLAEFMSRFNWMICPRTDLSMGWLKCNPDEIYVPNKFVLYDLPEYLPGPLADVTRALSRYVPSAIADSLGGLSVVARPMQLHAVVLAMFASIIAPFGGFFASGFKRGFKIKDFGDSIPGHGGMTDRMDCQVVMAMFSYLYFNSYVAREIGVTVGSVLSSAMQLDPDEQLELWGLLANMLAVDELVPGQLLGHVERAVLAGQQRLARYHRPR